MAEAAAISALASQNGEGAKPTEEIREAIKLGVDTGMKAEKALHQRTTELFKRDLPAYDFEKVAFQSLYGTGLFAVGFASVKLGQFLGYVVNTLNNMWGIGLLIDDNAVVEMNKSLGMLDMIDQKFLIPYGPLIPAVITGGSAFLEYLRIREGLPSKQRKMSDAACGLIGLGVFMVATTAKPRAEEGVIPPPPGSDKWTCAICAAEFNEHGALITHLRLEHGMG